MYYYHMTTLNNLYSIAEQGLIPKNENNGKLIGEEKVKVFFSEGFEGAIALYVDFDIVFDKIRKGQMNTTDKSIKNKVLKSKNLSDFLGEGVYLRFDGTGIKNERNFENGCTDMTILPENLKVCILRKRYDNSVIIFSRFEIVIYMMAKINPEQIKYYGAVYKDSPNFTEATSRIQEKVKKYYKDHKAEIAQYDNCDYILDFIDLKDFVDRFLSKIPNQ